MSTGTTLLLFVGSGGDSEAEALVNGCRQAVALDTLASATSLPGIDQIVVSTNARSFADQVGEEYVKVVLDPAGEVFHFGRRLQDIIRQQRVKRALYMGGGSGPLLSVDHLGDIVGRLNSAEHLLLVNNHYSTDFAAFTPAEIALCIDPPAFDNALSFSLAGAGLHPEVLPACAATLLDIDTPVDVMTAYLHPKLGPRARQYVEAQQLDLSRVERILELLRDNTAEVFVVGRVSSSAFSYLEAATACQTRALCEERGMRASGRQERGEVRSLAGYYMDAWGPEQFVRVLAQTCDGAIIDSRVLFAHRRVWPSTADRFYSDLLRPDTISDPYIREFTEAVMKSDIPIVLGGHSLVSGGLYALGEAAQSKHSPSVSRVGIP